MARIKDFKGQFYRLRTHAEEFISRKPWDAVDIDSLSTREIQRLVKELRAQNVELQMQNQNLRQSQMKMVELKGKCRELYDLAPVGYLTLDENGVILEANFTAIRFLGEERRRLIKIPLSRFIAEKFRETFRFHLQQIFETRSRPTCEIELIRHDDTRLHVHLESVALQDESGEFYRCQTTMLDVTKRKLAEEALTAEIFSRRIVENALADANAVLQARTDELLLSEERFRAIFESVQDCVFVKDRSLRYVLVNPFMQHLLGLPSSEIRGKTYEELFGQSDALYVGTIDQRVLNGESVELERAMSIRGENYTFLENLVPLRNPKGEVIGICGISRNVSGLKRERWKPTHGISRSVSKAMRKILTLSRTVARTDATVLLTGESGAGKDCMARYIHDHSNRADGPFFTLNCAALPQELAESELFGHEAGAFTGARSRKKGLLELAEGGTLMLNEIGELALPLQAKLLTFLDSKTFVKVGGEKNVSIDARIIAATNRDLKRAVSEGLFRSDLFHRLDVVSIAVPPLRERREDLPGLVSFMVSEIAARLHLSSIPEINPGMVEKLACYPWPGNVRELRNVLEHGLILCRGSRLTLDVLGLKSTTEPQTPSDTILPNGQSLNDMVFDLKMRYVQKALHSANGNRNRAARLLGITRFSLTRMMKTLGLLTHENGDERDA